MQANEKINPGPTQAERLGKVLTELRPNVTTEDRAKAMEEMEITHATLITYLKGQGKNSDLAARLVEIFRSRIENRENVLK